MVRLLLANGAHIDMRNNSELSPLEVLRPVVYYSVVRKNRDEEIISHLLEYGTSPKSEKPHNFDSIHDVESTQPKLEENNGNNSK